MKKATVGMVMLVSLVLIKAYISKDQSSLSIERGRDHSVTENIIESTSLRSDFLNAGKSQLTLIAQNFQHPEIPVQQHATPVSNVTGTPFDLNIEDLNEVQNDFVEDAVEEVVPMDYISNTGYGLLRTTTEKIISKTERIGKEPLDNGNTISENISKMFPRSL